MGLMGVALWLGTPAAQAQENPPEGGDATCINCHADLYYLHDTGKWHCLCDATPSCLHCHGGQPNTAAADEAHAGMIANPLQENAAVCQQCHCTDCEERVAEFLAVAGGTVTDGQGRVFPTSGPEPTPPLTGWQAYTLPSRLSEPWRQSGLALAAVGMAALGGYGVYCVWSDRRSERPT